MSSIHSEKELFKLVKISLFRKGKMTITSVNFLPKKLGTLIREHNQVREWYKAVWFPYSTPKYAYITWLAIQNCLATRDRLLRWNADASGSCVLRGDGVETRSQLFSLALTPHTYGQL